MIWTCTAAEYHADDSAIGSTMVRCFIDSPARYNALYVAHSDPKPEPTPDMILGTWVHCLVLEPAEWDARYAVQPQKWDRRKTEEKKAWQEWVESIGTREVIEWDSIPKLNLAQNMATAVRNSSLAMNYLGDYGEREISFRWQDKRSGLTLKVRLDNLEGNWIADLKTAADPSPKGFARAVVNHGYDIQAALYLEAVNLWEPGQRHDFYFVCVGKTPPHDVWVHQMPAHWIESGRRRLHEALGRIQIASETGVWLAPGQDKVSFLEPPRYAELEEV